MLLSSAAYAQPVAVRAYTNKKGAVGRAFVAYARVKTLNGTKAPAF